MHRDHAVSISFGQKKYAESSGADADGILQHGLEYWLQIAGRRADDAQHLRCCRLLLQRFGQVSRALAQFIEQPRILDGDDGLLGEIAEKLDLLFSEQTRLPTQDIEGADRLVVLYYWYGELRSVPGLNETNTARLAVEVSLVIGDVGDLDDLFQSDAAA